MSRLFISAAHKSSGKTMVSVGLAAALDSRGLRVQTFKKGPDYIDPMWLAHASRRACYNLDFNTQSEAEIVSTFTRGCCDADLALVEGNKGLHDGVDVEGADSSSALAKLLGAPVVLVVDTLGMTRGIAPLLLGYRAFDADVLIAGVILNKVGTLRQETKLRQAIEHYTDIPVLGAIGRDAAPPVEERHLGLTTPAESPALLDTIANLRCAVEAGVDLDRLLAIAASAPLPGRGVGTMARHEPDVCIAVARDAAFGFYYADDLEALERAGAEIVFFDAIQDGRLPRCDGLFIGGGFPETSAARLSANAALRADIRAKLRQGLPAYAECGGLMYLTRSIAWRDERHEMVGVVPADTTMRDRPQGRGLVVLEATADAPWPLQPRMTRAHEFHYAALENIAPASRFAYRIRRGFGVDGVRDGFVIGNLLASFVHLRDTDSNRWARRFVSFVRSKRTAVASREGKAKPAAWLSTDDVVAPGEAARIAPSSFAGAMLSRRG